MEIIEINGKKYQVINNELVEIKEEPKKEGQYFWSN